MAWHKRTKPAKRRGAAKLCMCNPHQKALGNTRKGWETRAQKVEAQRVQDWA